jgi:hypothetical protein
MGNRVSWHNHERGDFRGLGLGSVDGRAAGVIVEVFAAWLHAAICGGMGRHVYTKGRGGVVIFT